MVSFEKVGKLSLCQPESCFASWQLFIESASRPQDSKLVIVPNKSSLGLHSIILTSYLNLDYIDFLGPWGVNFFWFVIRDGYLSIFLIGYVRIHKGISTYHRMSLLKLLWRLYAYSEANLWFSSYRGPLVLLLSPVEIT